MEELIKNYLHNLEQKRVQTRAIEDYVGKKLGAGDYSYDRFVQAVEKLVTANKLQPIKARGQNGRVPQLYNWYRISFTEPELEPDLKQKLLTTYHPQLRMSYYFTHPQQYKKDKQCLQAIDRFLKNNPPTKVTAVNERSFQIFNDEKFLSSSRGTEILRRVGLDWADLGCYPTYEPFFYYRRENRSARQDILIIENKDTFFSFKKLMQENKFCWEQIEVSFLIYGEGKKIQTSFSFFKELGYYQKQNNEFDFYYFGDLDPAGISIWWGLQQNYELEFIPANVFYQALLRRYQAKAPELTTGQECADRAVAEFKAYFSPAWAQRIDNLLAAGKYIPQEGLSYQILRKISAN